VKKKSLTTERCDKKPCLPLGGKKLEVESEGIPSPASDGRGERCEGPKNDSVDGGAVDTQREIYAWERECHVETSDFRRISRTRG